MNELIYLFVVYSFWGWIFETVVAAIKKKHFVNRGIINGPFCIIYGVAAVSITIILKELNGFWLFWGSVIVTTLIEWIAGHIIERMYHERWWDYSQYKFNFDGYICLFTSMVWGIMGFIVKTWMNPLLLNLYALFPIYIIRIVVWLLMGLIVLDGVATILVLTEHNKEKNYWRKTEIFLDNISRKIGDKVYNVIDRRLGNAYNIKTKIEDTEKDKTKFAAGCGFYKLVVLFFVGGLLGDIVETIFCRIELGEWMSRSSVIYGPFSIVWGAGVAAVTLLLYKYKDKSIVFLFLTGTVLGGAYEYICSIFTEIVFGTVFWDYSDMPFNLGGRINLLYCSFWGVAAMVWFRLIYPLVSNCIEKIPPKIGVTVTWVLIVLMSFNVAISSMALVRYQQRSTGDKPKTEIECWIDARYDDARMQKVFPKALMVK